MSACYDYEVEQGLLVSTIQNCLQIYLQIYHKTALWVRRKARFSVSSEFWIAVQWRHSQTSASKKQRSTLILEQARLTPLRSESTPFRCLSLCTSFAGARQATHSRLRCCDVDTKVLPEAVARYPKLLIRLVDTKNEWLPHELRSQHIDPT